MNKNAIYAVGGFILLYIIIGFVLYKYDSSEPTAPGNSAAGVTDDREVFNVKGPLHMYTQAHRTCAKYQAHVATKEQLDAAYQRGANWCHLGWVNHDTTNTTGDESTQAYFPTQADQIKLAKTWPRQFQNACGGVGLNGGNYPSNSKLGVNCYGIKPTREVGKEINPWNTLTDQWYAK